VPSYPKSYLDRRTRGMKKCGTKYTACPYVREAKSLNSNDNK
jgi:hypothetical protein